MTNRPTLCGEIHYARVARADWPARLRMAAAMGCEAVSTYVFWNRHERAPERYDFTGDNDVAEYVRLAGRAGLRVVLRPGPYVCAEWDFGGLPPWLIADGPVPVRTADERYMHPVRRWLRRLGDELAPLQRPFGGPIAAVQLENEYGAYGDDKAYLAALRAALDDAGFGASPQFTIDQPDDLARGALDGVPAAVTFGPGGLQRATRALDALRPGAPKICGEYWAGWFSHWGETPAPDDAALQARELARMLADGWSVNLYMLHGGTNSSFWNGANLDGAPPRYRPVTTSYDYHAAIDEAGRPTPKYFFFRAIAQRRACAPLPALAAVPPTIDVPEFALSESAPLDALLRDCKRAVRPPAFEAIGGGFGYVLYRTTLPAGTGTLEIEDLRDFAAVSLDGVCAGYLDRRLGSAHLPLRAPRACRLELLVENCGRVNYGPALGDAWKGLRAVFWQGRELLDWEGFALPLDDLAALRFTASPAPAPAFFRGSFELSPAGGTFFDVSGLGKGVLFVNGNCAGRFWNVGPQRHLYVPGTWLREGRNEAVVFDLMPAETMTLRGERR